MTVENEWFTIIALSAAQLTITYHNYHQLYYIILTAPLSAELTMLAYAFRLFGT